MSLRFRARPVTLAASMLLSATIAACDDPTGPGTQAGFSDKGEKRYGKPTLIVSAELAVGREVQPIVVSDDLPQDSARVLARFKSTDARVVMVAPDGRLKAARHGWSDIIVNLDGMFDTVRVAVTQGIPQHFRPIPDGFTAIAVNRNGDVLARGATTVVLDREGAMRTIDDCNDPGTLNAAGDVTCTVPSPPACSYIYAPAVHRAGKTTWVLPDTMAGGISGIDDAGNVFGIYRTCPPYPIPPAVGYYMGQPGALRFYRNDCGHSCNTGQFNGSRGILNGTYSVHLVGDGVYEHVGGGSRFQYNSVVWLNNRDDLLGRTARLSGSVYDYFPWVTLGGPSVPGVADALKEGFVRCNHPSLLTDDRTAFGVGHDGWCTVRSNGSYTLLWDAISRTNEEDWYVLWTPSAPKHSSGLVVMPAYRTGTGEKGLMMIDVDR